MTRNQQLIGALKQIKLCKADIEMALTSCKPPEDANPKHSNMQGRLEAWKLCHEFVMDAIKLATDETTVDASLLAYHLRSVRPDEPSEPYLYPLNTGKRRGWEFVIETITEFLMPTYIHRNMFLEKCGYAPALDEAMEYGWGSGIRSPGNPEGK
jgi:hypothetical protein